MTNEAIRRNILFTAIPYAFFHRDDWDDLSRGLTWSELEVAGGESKRLVPYLCSAAKRKEVLVTCHKGINLPKAAPGYHFMKLHRDRDERDATYMENLVLGMNASDEENYSGNSENDIEEDDLDQDEGEFNFEDEEGM